MEFKHKSNYGFSGHIPIEIDQDSWRSLLSNIEAEFQTSQIYSNVLTDLKTSLAEAAAKADAQIKALGTDQIKINLKNLTSNFIPENKASSTKKSSPEINVDEKEKNIQFQQQLIAQSIQNNNNHVQKQMSQNLTTEIQSEIITESIPSSINQENTNINLLENDQPKIYPEESQKENNRQKRKKKLTKAEQAALAIQERHTYLYQLGEKLRKARQMRCLSLKQIHKQTFVPLHYIEAIEKGNIEELPEDIYLRGFIFRIGNTLGLDGASLAAAFPISDPLQGIIPSRSKRHKDSGFYLRPVHLYLGYTALMAGAISGLTWMSEQPNPGANLVPETPESPDSIADSDRHLENTQTPGLKSTTDKIVVGSDMAPPETMI
ncbi:MAG: helix-turn-helix domain-containing protein [Microcoleaceae cyanobacterium MO_207.B10]|nr:helix-turn-helix domain-containing protein [Microcoleaceae cyanobacterium MO_207.B10]